jgi:putative addiction module component (TIGR02574 family)
MATTLETVTEQALSLSSHERLLLVKELLESVEPQASEELERTWEEQISARIAKIDAGTVKGRSWEDIKKDFESRYGR